MAFEALKTRANVSAGLSRLLGSRTFRPRPRSKLQEEKQNYLHLDVSWDDKWKWNHSVNWLCAFGLDVHEEEERQEEPYRLGEDLHGHFLTDVEWAEGYVATEGMNRLSLLFHVFLRVRSQQMMAHELSPACCLFLYGSQAKHSFCIF